MSLLNLVPHPSPYGARGTRLARVTARPTAARCAGSSGRIAQVLVGLTIALAAAGAVLGVRQLTAAVPVVEAGQARVPTSFGSVQFGSLVVLQRPDPKDMFGMPPGMTHEEHPGNATVQVPATLTNTSDEAVPYSLDSFRLLAGDDREGVTDARIDTPEQLRPGSAITMRLTFSVPPAQTNVLRYSPPSGSPVEIPLGPVGGASGAAPGSAAHPSGSGHAGHGS